MKILDLHFEGERIIKTKKNRLSQNFDNICYPYWKFQEFHLE